MLLRLREVWLPAFPPKLWLSLGLAIAPPSISPALALALFLSAACYWFCIYFSLRLGTFITVGLTTPANICLLGPAPPPPAAPIPPRGCSTLEGPRLGLLGAYYYITCCISFFILSLSKFIASIISTNWFSK